MKGHSSIINASFIFKTQNSSTYKIFAFSESCLKRSHDSILGQRSRQMNQVVHIFGRHFRCHRVLPQTGRMQPNATLMLLLRLLVLLLLLELDARHGAIADFTRWEDARFDGGHHVLDDVMAASKRIGAVVAEPQSPVAFETETVVATSSVAGTRRIVATWQSAAELRWWTVICGKQINKLTIN